MLNLDFKSLAHIVKFAAFGGFGGMVLAGWLLALDVSAIRSLFDGTPYSLLPGLFLSGTMLKGALIGFVIGCATLPANNPKTAPTT